MTLRWAFWLAVGLTAGALAAAETPFRWERDGREVRCVGAPGCYLYAEATQITALRPDGSEIPFAAPETVRHEDELSGASVIYPAAASPWVWRAAEDLPSVVTVAYQGCRMASAEAPALCYPPAVVELSAGTNPHHAIGTMPPEVTDALTKFRSVSVRSGLLDKDELCSWIKSCKNDGKVTDASVTSGSAPVQGFWAVFLLVVLGGLGLNLTPCVLPMIPINLALIGAGAGASKKQGFRRGLWYAVGIALTYGALGIPAVLFGTHFGTINSGSFFNFAVAALFAILAVGMFGAYQLDFSRFGTAAGGPQRRSGLPADLAAFGMGAVAALLAGACVAPVVISVLMLAATLYGEGHVWGAFLPLALGASMALPWPFAGMGLAVLPKPGAWMAKVKIALGVLIAALAVYYAVLGVKLLPGQFDQPREVEKLAAALNEAAAKREPVLLKFSASWCKNCAALKRTMNRPQVQDALQDVRVIDFRAEHLGDPAVKAILDHWALPGLPALVMLTPAERAK